MADAFDRCPGCFAEPWVEGRPCAGCGYELDPGAFWTALRPGSVLADRYLVGRVLGRPGGFGVTYLAWDRVLERRVAMKELMPRMLVSRDQDRTTIRVQTDADRAQFRQTLAWFLDEARMIARFNHPNLVRVLDYFEENGTAYFAMDYYEGRTLAEHLAVEGPRVPWQEALDVILPILDGLEVVHAEGVLHRDVKPTNLYLAAAGRPILLDFGTARAALAGETGTLTSFHSPGYTPPEQLAGRREGPWTDVYGCAATLYEMLTGRTPVESAGLVPAEERESPKHVGPAIPDHVSDAVMRGLATRPEERPASAAAFGALLQGEPVPAEDEVSAAWKERKLGGGDREAPAGEVGWKDRRAAAAVGSASATEVLGGSSDFEPGPVGGSGDASRRERETPESSLGSRGRRSDDDGMAESRRWIAVAALAVLVLGAGSFAAASIWSGTGGGGDDVREAASAVADTEEETEPVSDVERDAEAEEVDPVAIDPATDTVADAIDLRGADPSAADPANAAVDADASAASSPAEPAGPPPTGLVVVVYGEEGRVAETLVTRRILQRSDLTAVDPDGLAVVRRDARAIVDAGDVSGLAELGRQEQAEVLAIGRLTTDVGASAVSPSRVTGSARLTFTLYRVSDGRTLGSEVFDLPTGVQGTTPGDVRTEAARRVARMAADAAIRWLEEAG